MHQLPHLSIHPNWCVIDQRTADLEQFTLTRQVSFVFSLLPLIAASSDCQAVDGLIALDLVTKLGGPWPQWGRVSPRTILNRQPANLGMKFFDLVVLILGLFDLV